VFSLSSPSGYTLSCTEFLRFVYFDATGGVVSGMIRYIFAQYDPDFTTGSLDEASLNVTNYISKVPRLSLSLSLSVSFYLSFRLFSLYPVFSFFCSFSSPSSLFFLFFVSFSSSG
jgi:hypothetical protein